MDPVLGLKKLQIHSFSQRLQQSNPTWSQFHSFPVFCAAHHLLRAGLYAILAWNRAADEKFLEMQDHTTIVHGFGKTQQIFREVY